MAIGWVCGSEWGDGGRRGVEKVRVSTDLPALGCVARSEACRGRRVGKLVKGCGSASSFVAAVSSGAEGAGSPICK